MSLRCSVSLLKYGFGDAEGLFEIFSGMAATTGSAPSRYVECGSTTTFKKEYKYIQKLYDV